MPRNKVVHMEKGTKIPLIFNGRRESLKIVGSGGDLVKYLTRTNPICPLIESKIKQAKKLGSGKRGTVFLIEIEGLGTRQYAVKKTEAEVEFVSLTKYIGEENEKFFPLSDIVDEIAEDTGLTAETIIAYNGGKPSMPTYRWTSLWIPNFLRACKTDKQLTFPKADGKGVVVFPPGSYLCPDSAYSEYINSILAGQLISNCISANFFNVFEFITCPKKGSSEDYYQYTFMEKIDTSLESALGDIFVESPSYISSSIVVQILHAIATYQHYYRLSHNDLHADNVFIEYVRPDTIFNGQTLSDADYFHYHVKGVDLYVPASKYIVKIGDWGMSVKYTIPIIGDRRAIETGYDLGKSIKWVPNWFADNYDSMFIIQSIRHIIMKKYGIRSAFIEKIWASALNLPYEPFDLKQIDIATDDAINDFRVKIKRLNEFPKGSPMNILTNPRLMGDFMVKPSKGKIVTIGDVD